MVEARSDFSIAQSRALVALGGRVVFAERLQHVEIVIRPKMSVDVDSHRVVLLTIANPAADGIRASRMENRTPVAPARPRATPRRTRRADGSDSYQGISRGGSP